MSRHSTNGIRANTQVRPYIMFGFYFRRGPAAGLRVCPVLHERSADQSDMIRAITQAHLFNSLGLRAPGDDGHIIAEQIFPIPLFPSDLPKNIQFDEFPDKLAGAFPADFEAPDEGGNIDHGLLHTSPRSLWIHKSILPDVKPRIRL